VALEIKLIGNSGYGFIYHSHKIVKKCLIVNKVSNVYQFCRGVSVIVGFVPKGVTDSR
jgi:hypothetical protein